MAKTLIVCRNVITIAYNANVTSYSILGVNEGGTETTEANTKIPFSVAGTFSNLYLRVTANTVTATSTWRLRVNGANVNSVISIASSTTGEFEDTSNTDTISANDQVNYQLVTGATGTSLSLTIGSIVFSASSNTLMKWSGNNGTAGANWALSSATEYTWIGGKSIVSNFSESPTQTQVGSAGTWKRFYTYVSANARVNDMVIRSRVAGGEWESDCNSSFRSYWGI